MSAWKVIFADSEIIRTFAVAKVTYTTMLDRHYNTLITRRFAPPLFHCGSVSYDTNNGAIDPAAHSQSLCRQGLLFSSIITLNLINSALLAMVL